MRKSEIAIACIIIASIAVGAYFYSQMPDKIAIHWNAAGEANGFAPKLLALSIIPVISIIMFLLFVAIPRIYPLRKNIAQFRNYFDGFIVVIFLFLFYLQVLTIFSGFLKFGFQINLMQFLSPAFAAVFYSAGILISKAKRNWFIGIRTPWTMSSEKVWNKTHAIGGKLFKAVGVICLLGIVWPNHAIFFILVPIIAVVIFAFVYSYVEFKKTKKRKK